MKVRQVYDDGSLVILRDHNGQWWKIVQDCVQCGKCCMDVSNKWPWYDEDRGGCKYLVEEVYSDKYRCSLGKSGRAFRCAGNSPFSQVEYCVVSFEEIEVEEAINILTGTP
jgi:hypothetical protein